MAKHKMGRWDCTSCDKVGNIGTDKTCSGCASPRPKNVRFYLPTEAEEVSEEIALSGADWICDHCDAHNANTSKTCHSCGNERNHEDESLKVRTYRTKDIDTSEEAKNLMLAEKKKQEEQKERDWENSLTTYRNLEREREQEQRQLGKPRKNYSGHRSETTTRQVNLPTRKILSIGGGIAVLSALIYLFIWLTAKEVDTAIVSGREYTSWTLVSDYKVVGHDTWERPPSDGFNVRTKEEVHHYDEVFDGYETYYEDEEYVCGTEEYQSGTRSYQCGTDSRDNGNGTFTDVPVYCDDPVYSTRDKYCTRQVAKERKKYRDEPVYATKYYWDRWEWVRRSKGSCPVQTVQNEQKIHYPEVTESDGLKVVGHEHSLKLFIERPGHEYSRHTWRVGSNLEIWKQYPNETSFDAYFRKNGNHDFVGPVPPDEK